MKQQINFRASELTARQLESLMSKWGTSQTETLTVVIDRIFQQEKLTMNSYDYTIYGDGEDHGFKVFATPKSDSSKRHMIEDSSAVYDTFEDAVYVAKAAVKKHEYQDWRASVQNDPEYQEFINRSAAAID